MQTEQSLASIVANIISAQVDAAKLARTLSVHQRGAPAELHGYLNRLETALREFGLTVAHATAALSPATKAAIEAR
jgi:hypothetical protein